MNNLQSSIEFALAGVSKINNKNEKKEVKGRIKKIAKELNIEIQNTLEGKNHFEGLNQVEIQNRVTAVLSNIGTMAQKEANNNNNNNNNNTIETEEKSAA